MEQLIKDFATAVLTDPSKYQSGTVNAALEAAMAVRDWETGGHGIGFTDTDSTGSLPKMSQEEMFALFDKYLRVSEQKAFT